MPIDRLFRPISAAAIASVFACTLSLTPVAASAAVLKFSGTFTSYTTVLGASDPYQLGLPESVAITLTTQGTSVSGGSISFSDSGVERLLSGGSLTFGPSTDFTGISLASPIGGTLSVSFATSIADSSTSSLATLVGSSGAFSVFGFPFSTGAQGFYQGRIALDSVSDRVSQVPLPGTVALLGAGLVAGFCARSKRS